MKKVIALIAILIAIALIAIVVIQPKNTTIEPEDILSENIIAFTSYENGSEEFEFWKSSKFYEEISKLDIKKVLQKNHLATAEDIKQVDEYMKEVSKYSYLAEQLFGLKTVIAIEEIDFEKYKNNIKKPIDALSLLDKIIVISKPKINTDILSEIDKLFGENYKSVSSMFLDRTIKTIKLDDNIDLSYCFSNGYLIISFSKEVIKNSIKRIDTPEKKRLSDNMKYVEMKKKFKSGWTNFSYFDLDNTIQPFCKTIAQVMKDNNLPKSQVQQIEIMGDMYKGFKSAGCASYRESKIITNKSIISINKKEMNDVVKTSYNAPLKAGETLGMIPENPIFYAAMSLDLESQITAMSKSNGMDLERMKPMYSIMLGADFDSLVNSFGNVFGVLLSDINTDSIKPAPIFSVFMEIKDREVIENCLNQFIKRMNMKLPKEKFKTVEITYFDIFAMTGLPIKPSFVFYKNYFIISSDLDLIKDMIESDESGNNLLKSKYINSNEKLSAISLINIAQGVDAVEKSLDKVPELNANPQIKSNITEIAGPIFNAFKTFDIVTYKTKVTENEIISDFFFKIK